MSIQMIISPIPSFLLTFLHMNNQGVVTVDYTVATLTGIPYQFDQAV